MIGMSVVSFLVAQVEAEEQPETSELYGVASVPLFLFFKVCMLLCA